MALNKVVAVLALLVLFVSAKPHGHGGHSREQDNSAEEEALRGEEARGGEEERRAKYCPEDVENCIEKLDQCEAMFRNRTEKEIEGFEEKHQRIDKTCMKKTKIEDKKELEKPEIREKYNECMMMEFGILTSDGFANRSFLSDYLMPKISNAGEEVQMRIRAALWCGCEETEQTCEDIDSDMCDDSYEMCDDKKLEKYSDCVMRACVASM